VQVTGWQATEEPALRAYKLVLTAPGRVAGLTPIYLQRTNRDGHAQIAVPSGHITFGARGDSYYEYMVKQYIAGGLRDATFLTAYTDAMAGVRRWLLGATAPAAVGGLMYVGEIDSHDIRPDAQMATLRSLLPENRGSPPAALSPKVDHLTCFLPGVLALGHMHGVETGEAELTVRHRPVPLPFCIHINRIRVCVTNRDAITQLHRITESTHLALCVSDPVCDALQQAQLDTAPKCTHKNKLPHTSSILWKSACIASVCACVKAFGALALTLCVQHHGGCACCALLCTRSSASQPDQTRCNRVTNKPTLPCSTREVEREPPRHGAGREADDVVL
jgi:hypothetical protein